MVHKATIGKSFITEEFLAGAAAVEGLSLGAVYSRSLEKGEALARRFGAQQVYTDLEALAGAEIDAVYIASPNSLHFAQCEMFLKRDKHFFVKSRLPSRPKNCFRCNRSPSSEIWCLRKRS
jgi:predicted dehydrogenase